MSAPRVSVIVPFRNRPDDLVVLFDSLEAQDCTAPWEVVAVDNGATAAARKVAERYVTRLPLIVATATEQANPAYARNAGARAAGGSHLLFIDADDAVAPSYVSAMDAALDEHAFVTSRVDSAILNPEWVRQAHGPPWQAEEIVTFLGFLPGAGANVGIRRELFERLGGFSSEFHGSEDLAFSWVAQLESGEAPHFVPDAVYYYRYRDSYSALLRQSMNWGRDHVLLFRRFRARGMPGRGVREAAAEWARVIGGFVRGPRSEWPALTVRGGYCLGRLAGSLRYRVFYF